MSWPDQDTWRFINTFAPWASALGTFLAVSVSLYLATSDRRIKAKVDSTVWVVMTEGFNETERFIGVSVVNLGMREVTLTSLGWVIGFPFYKTHIAQLGFGPRSNRLPVSLKFGEKATFYVPLTHTDDHWVDGMKGYLGRFPRITVLTMKVHISTTIDKSFSRRVGKQIRELLTSCKVVGNE